MKREKQQQKRNNRIKSAIWFLIEIRNVKKMMIKI